MTTERMIRVNFEDNRKIAELGTGDLMPIWIRIEDTEPAPPEDWKPVCYCEKCNIIKDVFIDERTVEIGHPCIDCTFRKRD
jgi:hypothetical protein